MKNFNTYINENTTVDESAILTSQVFRWVGILLLSKLIPFLISLGADIIKLNWEGWVTSLQNKFPKHKDAIFILMNALRNNLSKTDSCKTFIQDSERQKSDKTITIGDIKTDIIPFISNDDDKQKVINLLDFIESEKFAKSTKSV